LGKIIAVHSYKGGTGKTIVSTNLAVTLTRHGRKACLMDLDFRAPSLSTIFSQEELDCWLNDYLNGTCRIEKALTNFNGLNNDGELFLGLADPSTEAIRDMSAKDRKWEMRALGRLLSLKNSLTNDLGFDYVILDTSPGLQYSSINAIVAADLVIVATTFDRSDMKGTKRMLHELYELFEKKTEIVVNKVLYDVSSNSDKTELQTKIQEAYQTPVLGVIPCFCDVARAEGAFIFSNERPEHPFTKIMDCMVEKIEKNGI
jgi:septum site-determining protein MinD